MRDVRAYDGDSTEAAVFRSKILNKLGTTEFQEIDVVALDGKARAVVTLPGGRFRWFNLLTSGDVEETEGYARS